MDVPVSQPAPGCVCAMQSELLCSDLVLVLSGRQSQLCLCSVCAGACPSTLFSPLYSPPHLLTAGFSIHSTAFFKFVFTGGASTCCTPGVLVFCPVWFPSSWLWCSLILSLRVLDLLDVHHEEGIFYRLVICSHSSNQSRTFPLHIPHLMVTCGCGFELASGVFFNSPIEVTIKALYFLLML